ncbi:flagellar protein FliS [Erythrobacter tepidarius]|uniref:flagellar protein FliS n=1 Tax=Erythrobacter tepidarius TaxID=60454 RepID=UPI000A3B877D|nr:flagellar protein FliS [Erythrobacter tepidarius]
MRMLSHNPAAAYRRVELDARIEAAGPADLTRICLEEAVAALGQALIALERAPDSVPRAALARAQAITMWLARSVAPEHPLRESLVTFYAGLAHQIAGNFVRARAEEIARVRGDLSDLLAAAA